MRKSVRSISSALVVLVSFWFSSKALSSEIPTLTGELLDEIIAEVKSSAKPPPEKDPFMTDEEYKDLLAEFYSNNSEPYGTYKLEFKPNICDESPFKNRVSRVLCYFVKGERFIFGAPLGAMRFISDFESSASQRQTLIQRNLGTSTTVLKNHNYYSQVVPLNELPLWTFPQDRKTVQANFDDYSIHVVLDLRPEHQLSLLDYETEDLTRATLTNPYEHKTSVRTVFADLKYYALYLDGNEVFNSESATPISKLEVVNYPKKARDKGWVGRVGSSFSVNKKGQVTDVEVSKYGTKCWLLSKYAIERYRENAKPFKHILKGSDAYRKMLLEGQGYENDGFDKVMNDFNFVEFSGRCKLFNKSVKKTLQELRFDPELGPFTGMVTLYYIDTIGEKPAHFEFNTFSRSL